MSALHSSRISNLGSGLINPRKILIVIGSLDRGGCEIHLSKVLPRLKAQGFRPEIFTLARPGELSAAMEDGGVPVHRPWIEDPRKSGFKALRASRLLLAGFQLWVHLLRHRPNLIHFFLPLGYMLGVPVVMLSGIRLRIMSRRSLNDYQRSYPKFLTWFEHILHQRTTLILGNSRKVVDQLIHEEGVSAERALLLYNGIETSPLKSDSERSRIRSNLNIRSSPFVITCVANLIAYKGHMDLLDALALAREDLPDNWKLLIVGRDDGIGKDLDQKANAIGLTNNISSLGQRLDVNDIYIASDIGVLCSHEEGFSNAILEGMNAALPMIVTNVGGNAEAVVHNKTGLVVPPKNPDALAKAIVQLASDPEMRKRMGQAGRHRIEQHFNIDACVGKYAAVYDALLDDQPLEALLADKRFKYGSLGVAEHSRT